MAEVINFDGCAIYDYSGVSGSKFTKTASQINLPITASVSPSGTDPGFVSKTLMFAFPIPAKFKYKKITVIWDIHYSQSTSQSANRVSPYLCPIYKTSNIFIDETTSNAGYYNISYASGPYLPDENTDTNRSHGVTPLTVSRMQNGSYNNGVRFTVYTGPANYIIGALNIMPGATYNPNATYGAETVTVSSAALSIEDNGEEYEIIEPTYPVNVNIKSNANQIFTWNRSNTIPAESQFNNYNVPILKHAVKYWRDGETPEEIIENGSNNYLEIIAGTFSGTGKMNYCVRLYDTYDNIIESAEALFNIVGQDAAPTINSVTNENIPTVAWSDTNQDAFIVRVKDQTQKIIFDSGIVAGNAESFEIPKMFENGTYIVEVKELNTYGYFSEWGSLEFTLEPEEVDPPTDIFAFVNNQYGVEIQGIPAEDAAKTFVVRKEKGSNEVEIIGEYTGTPFIDYSTKGGVFYEYTLRNYNEGYKDGEWIPLQTKIKEIIIQDGRDLSKFIELYMTGNSNFAPDWIEEVDRTLYNCLGRKYPVKEPGEWINAERSFTAYIKEEKWAQLYDMALNAPKVYYKAKGEYFACDMQIEDAGRYIGGGRMVKFNLTRIDDEGISIL